MDPYDLQRFVTAQNRTYPQVLAELRRGRKASHWMWFIFPQLRGLGQSAMARQFAISSLEEARAYLDHPVLGERLIECTRLLLNINDRTLLDILGSPDDLKFRSCMTLFLRAAEDDTLFAAALRQYCGGEPDPLTVRALDATPAPQAGGATIDTHELPEDH